MEKIDLPEELSNFLKLLEQVQKDYFWYKDEEIRLDQLTQDYLHKLELENTTYHERARIATDLRQCRIDRRGAKDTITLLEPMVDFLGSDKGKILVSQLQQILGSTRKAAKNAQLRKYAPRVLKAEEYNGSAG